MTLNELGSLGEFVGAIAVVISLIYLAIQIRHNTRAVQSTTHQAVLDGILRVSASLSDSEGMAQISRKATSHEMTFRYKRPSFFGVFVVPELAHGVVHRPDLVQPNVG